MTFHLVPSSGSSRSQATAERPAAPPAGLQQNADVQFSTLDGREIIVLGRRWRVEVYSLWDLHACRYVQLALQGEPTYMLTVQLAAGHGAADLVAALVRWLTNPTSMGELVRTGS